MNNKILPLKKIKAIRFKLSVASLVILFGLMIGGIGLTRTGSAQSAFFGLSGWLAQATPTPVQTDETGPAIPSNKTKKSKKKDDGSRGCLDCDPGGGGGGGSNVQPVSYTGGPYYSEAGQTLQTYGGNSYDPDGTIYSYQWNFGDGTTGTGVSPTHTYAEDGTYTVSLTVTDNLGAINFSSSTVTVNANPESVTVGFDNLPVGTVVQDQYLQKESVRFSSSNNFYYPPMIYSTATCCATKSAPNFLVSHPPNAYQEIYLDFAKPVSNFSFYVIGSDSLGAVGYIDVYQNGTKTQTYYIPGVGNPYVPIHIDAIRSLTNITHIRIHSITDVAGLGFDDFTFTPVGKIDSVSFEQIDSLIDTNPNYGGGLSANDNRRIFPDKQSPSDPINRRRVRVRANTSLGANKTVYFRALDVDDPSTDTAPVDTNGTAGGDNKGTPATAYGGLSALSAQTDSSGVATVEFMTTVQPGDNFRVAASTDQAYLNGLLASSVNVRDSAGTLLPTDKAKVTQMLTVWRSVHIEVDSMGLVTGNRITGTITGGFCRSNPPGQPPAICEEVSIILDRSDIGTGYGDNYNGSNRFIPGRLIVNNVWYEVLGVDDVFYECLLCAPKSVIRIKAPGGNRPPEGAPYILVDDDDFDNDDEPNLDGDYEEDIEALAQTFLLAQYSDSPAQNVFAAAYIRPVYDGGGPPTVAGTATNNNFDIPFNLNVLYPTGVNDQINVGRNSEPNERDDFWVAYLLIGYQPDASEDEDPDAEDPAGGYTSSGIFRDDPESPFPKGGFGSLIFLETQRDLDRKGYDLLVRTVPHELGHQFGLRGDNMSVPEFGIMNPTGLLTFGPRHLNLLRSRVRSPGQ